jgi:hypothetical protein
VDIPARRERDVGLSVDCVCDVLGELHDIGVRLSRVKEFERKLAQIFLGRFAMRRLYQQPLRDDDFFCERAACTAIIIFLGKCIVKQIIVVLLL